MGEFHAQDHTGRKRNPKCREQIPSDSRAVESQRIIGPFWKLLLPDSIFFFRRGSWSSSGRVVSGDTFLYF